MEFVIDILSQDLGSTNFQQMAIGQTSFFSLSPGKEAFQSRWFEHGRRFFVVIGDLIFPSSIDEIHEKRAEFLHAHHQKRKIHELKGFFYLLVFDISSRTVEIHSSFLNILPIFYRVLSGRIIVSSSMKLIRQQAGNALVRDKIYPLEKVLFNYSFLNRTPFSDISLVRSGHHVRIGSEGLEQLGDLSLTEILTKSPRSWKSHLDDLADVFIREMREFIPLESYAVTLTGGFDGRTILSLANPHASNFEAFSYGSVNDLDISVPRSICKALGIRYSAFLLDRNYAKDRFWQDGLDLTRATEGAANISRAHYVYTATELSKRHRFLICGNFGSELLRSLKNPGVMATPALFALFTSTDRQEFAQFVKNQSISHWLRPDLLQEGLDEFLDAAWAYKASLPCDYSLNMKFYIYVLSEIFRKYFGPEIVMQSSYLINRSPFLSFYLVKALLETSMAGAYSEFREQNPFRRFHGQVLYAHILKKTNPLLLDMPLDRGYLPGDFLSIMGKLRIAAGYVKKTVTRSKDRITPSYSTPCYDLNKKSIIQIIDGALFLDRDHVMELLTTGAWKYRQAEFANALSLEMYAGEMK